MITAQFENQENGITRHTTHFKKIAPSTGLSTAQQPTNNEHSVKPKHKQQEERKQYSLRGRK